MLHNLLPKERKRDLRNEYIVRMISVSAFLVSVSVLIGAVSLVPTYISISSALGAQQPKDGASNDGTGQTPISELGRAATLLQTLNTRLDVESMTTLLDTVVSARPKGVELTGITFERNPLSFSLQGIASTRDALVAYKRALENVERVTEVSSPISDLAKSTDLEFTLTVLLSVQKNSS